MTRPSKREIERALEELTSSAGSDTRSNELSEQQKEHLDTVATAVREKLTDEEAIRLDELADRLLEEGLEMPDIRTTDIGEEFWTLFGKGLKT